MSTNKIPANQLVETIDLVDNYIEAAWDELFANPAGVNIDEICRLSYEQGKENFLQHITSTYDSNAKDMLDGIINAFTNINDYTTLRYYTHKQPNHTSKIFLGVLLKNSSQKTADENAKALEKTSALLRDYYTNAVEFKIASAALQKQFDSIESIEAGLAEDKAEMLNELTTYANGEEFFMITIFCDDPRTFELTTEEEAKLISQMRESQQKEISLDLTTPENSNQLSTPRLRA